MTQRATASEIRAAAEAHITAQTKAQAAKKAWDEKPDDANLKAAYESAQQAAATAQSAADALSQEVPKLDDKQIAKKKRRMAIIRSELQAAGALDTDEDDDDIDDEDDDEKPVTRGELKRMQAQEARATTDSMVQAITDADAKAAVQEALKSVVPSGDPARDFKAAVAIANAEKNSKVLEEISRRPAPQIVRNGAGAPARKEEEPFVPTAEEQKYMRPPFSLTKEQILKARGEQK